ncbi:MAG TPA: hypothetical protein PK110_10470 [Niabella sp.]|nr:hypothetical protein [Chitinophagaceae bacterium]HRO85236.1 hypothetical protein [Niabella sp.]HUN02907.1 hypothetical protein [Niabella sp.]
MGKMILAVYYSQTGQLKQIVDNFTQPLVEAGHSVEFLEVKMARPFPFPWPTDQFFDTVPDSVEVVPAALEAWETKHSHYDLVILGWQPWNLSPSIPFNSIMQDEKFKSIIKNTPVITISGCRNMWINAQEKNKRLIKAAESKLVGNIALMDLHANHISYFTILHWMGTGRKDRKWGIFPKPGVSDEVIKNVSVFGKVVNKYLQTGEWEELQPELIKKGAVRVKYSLMFIEHKAGKIFQKWVNLIRKFPKKRKLLLAIYKYYITIALLIVSPIILLVDFIFFRPFLQKRIKKQINYYSGVEIK